VHGSLPSQSPADMFIESKAMEYDNFLLRNYNNEGSPAKKKMFFYGDVVWKPILQNWLKIFQKISWVNWFSAGLNDQSDKTTIDELIGHFDSAGQGGLDWDFIISMTAELDHNVHLTKLSLPKISTILQQDDKLIRRLIEKLPEDVL
jgi:hypothetical protein